MTPMSDIQALLERFSLAWQALDTEALRGVLHPDVVFVPPGFAGKVRGRDACIETYRQFLEAARVTSYREPDTTIEIFGRTAVATVRWEMSWEMNGAAHAERGRDVLVLLADDPRWEIVWRTQIADVEAPR